MYTKSPRFWSLKNGIIHYPHSVHRPLRHTHFWKLLQARTVHTWAEWIFKIQDLDLSSDSHIRRIRHVEDIPMTRIDRDLTYFTKRCVVDLYVPRLFQKGLGSNESAWGIDVEKHCKLCWLQFLTKSYTQDHPGCRMFQPNFGIGTCRQGQ